jgi:hypothetical protein
MRRGVLLAFLLPAAVVAAPVPKERDEERLKRVFGTVVAPDTECEFELLPGDRLRVRLPGRAYTLDPSARASSAPRVVREVEGDFVLRVRVAEVIDKTAGPALRGQTPQVSAGLLLRAGDDVRADLTRSHQSGQNGWSSSIRFGARQPGRGLGSSTGFQFDPKPVHLRLTRTGPKVRGEYSSDGKSWRRLTETDLPLGEKVSVGLFAAGGLDTAFEAVFDEFTLTQPKPDK